MHLLARPILVLALLAGTPAAAKDDLSWAASEGNIAKVQTLLDNGWKINEIDSYGWNALLWSVYYGNLAMAQWLLDHGADPNVQNTKRWGRIRPGATPLILAAYYDHPVLVAALLAKKADPSTVDSLGRNAESYAREFNHEKILALLK